MNNKLLKRIYEPKKMKIRGDWRKLHSKELYNLYSPIYEHIIVIIKSRRIKWIGYVERMGKRYLHTKFRQELLKERTLRKTKE